MSDIEKVTGGKLSRIVEGVEFDNDFGQELIGVGHITQDKGVIAIASLIGLFLGTSLINAPFGVLILLLGLNDWIALNRIPTSNRVVDTVANPAKEEECDEYHDSLPQKAPAIGQDTRLNAVEVPVTPITNPHLPTPKITRSAYTLILDNPFQSLAIFGAQRTGKSYLAAIASQELHRRGIPIYAINLARYGEEDDVYWAHCNRAVLGDISEMRLYEANQLIEQAIEVVEEFYSQPKAILIFDEWAYAGGKNNAHTESLEPLLKLMADKLSVLTSTGIKRGRAIWTLAPEFVAKDLQEPAKAIKKSKLLYVTIAPSKSINWRGNEIKFDDQLFAQVKYNYPIEYPEGRFTQERICYLNKEWIEMGDLPPLDPSLRPAIQPQQSIQPQQAETPNKQQLEAEMVARLRATCCYTLWEFARDELGINDAQEIKELLEEIANLIFDKDLTSLQEKFRLQSRHDIRYSYTDYQKKVAQSHQYTGNKCCCCLDKQSEQAHHSRYEGLNDEPGLNLVPVCLNCHKLLCHSRENWKQGRIWESSNTPEWEAKLKAGFEMLAKGSNTNG